MEDRRSEGRAGSRERSTSRGRSPRRDDTPKQGDGEERGLDDDLNGSAHRERGGSRGRGRSRSPSYRSTRRSESIGSSRGGRRSNSRSPSGKPLHPQGYWTNDKEAYILNIADEDASFILGSGEPDMPLRAPPCQKSQIIYKCLTAHTLSSLGGRTKRKLSHVCGADLNILEREGRTVLEIRGTPETIEKAKLYIGFVMQQRVGPVALPPDAEKRDDLTIIEVPHECVGYVTGRKGAGLRSVEEEWNTLMFFTDLRSREAGETEKLAIFGDLRARRGSELKVMSAVEQKMPGYFIKDDEEHLSSNPDFDTDRIPIKLEDYSYALGQRGSTRKKLARASGAILEYVGRHAYIAGNLAERTRARQYLQWLCAQRTSYVHVETNGRDDCDVVALPVDAVAYVTGSKGSNLRRAEDETGTFIFLDGSRGGRDERLLIFGWNAEARQRARQKILDRVDEKMSGRARPVGGGPRYRSRSPRYDRGYGGRGYGGGYNMYGSGYGDYGRYGNGEGGGGRGGSGYYGGGRGGYYESSRRSRSPSRDYERRGRSRSRDHYSGRGRSRSPEGYRGRDRYRSYSHEHPDRYGYRDRGYRF